MTHRLKKRPRRIRLVLPSTPAPDTDKAEQILDFLLRNFGGFQRCYNLYSPPRNAEFAIVEPLPTSSCHAQVSGLDPDNCIPPGIYEITDGNVYDQRFWISLRSRDGRTVEFDIGNNGTKMPIDWREVIPAN